MASIWKDERSPYLVACVTGIKGSRRVQWKKTTGVNETVPSRKDALRLAERIADEMEQAAQGKRTPAAVKEFLAAEVEDLRTRRIAQRSFESVMREVTGNGLVETSVRGYTERWLAVQKAAVAPTSYSRYRAVCDAFLTSLAGRADQDMNELDKAAVLRFRDSELARVSPTSVRQTLKILRMMLSAAESDGVLSRAVARAKDMKIFERKSEKAARRPFTLPELKTLLAAADDEWRGMILMGLYGGGMRLGDVAALTWENVDLSANVLAYTSRKTGRTQRVPLAKPLQRALLDIAGTDDPRAPVFPKAHATVAASPMGRAVTLSGQFMTLLATAGLVAAKSHKAKEDGKGRAVKRKASELGFHCLRHTAVSLFKAAGVPQSVVMDIAGHESEAMSEHYTHTGDAAMAEAVAKLPDVTRGRRASPSGEKPAGKRAGKRRDSRMRP